MTSKLQRRMARITWDTVARTQPGRGRRVSDDVLNEVERLHDSGAYKEAARLLDAEPVERDPKALVLLGLAEFGSDNYEESLTALDRASCLAAIDLAKIQINRTVALASLERLEDALAAIDQAQTLAPFMWIAILQEMAIRQRRDAPGDFERVIKLADHLVKQWADWRSVDDGELSRYLALDPDHELLRSRKDGGVFHAIFGLTPGALAQDHRPGGPFHKPVDLS